jgi:hypothetical protein
MKVVLIACASKKLNLEEKAKNLYISALFKKSLSYAESLNPDKIFILSAKHGLLDLNKEISPYNETLNNLKKYEIKKWADFVLVQLKKTTNLEKDEYVFLAGNNYRKFLIPHIQNYSVPLQGLGIGKQLQWLTEKLK